MWPNPQFHEDLVTFTEEILTRKLFGAVNARHYIKIVLPRISVIYVMNKHQKSLTQKEPEK